MGRSQRKDSFLEALRPLGDAGLPHGWGEFWYGSSEDDRVFSSFLPELDPEIFQSLQSGRYTRNELLLLLSNSRCNKECFSLTDPFVHSLWEGEWKSLQSLLAGAGATGMIEATKREKETIRDLWARGIGRGVEIHEGGSWSKVGLSLFGRVLFQDLSALSRWQGGKERELESELVEGLLGWKNEEAFCDHAMRVLLPGIADRFTYTILWQNTPSKDLRLLFHKLVESLFSKEYCQQLEDDYSVLRSAGYLEAGVDEGDFYRMMLLEIAKEYAGVRPDLWHAPSQNGHRKLLRRIIEKTLAPRGFDGWSEKRWLSSSFAKAVFPEEARLGWEHIEAAKDTVDSFEREDYDALLRGKKDILETWKSVKERNALQEEKERSVKEENRRFALKVGKIPCGGTGARILTQTPEYKKLYEEHKQRIWEIENRKKTG